MRLSSILGSENLWRRVWSSPGGPHFFMTVWGGIGIRFAFSGQGNGVHPEVVAPRHQVHFLTKQRLFGDENYGRLFAIVLQFFYIYIHLMILRMNKNTNNTFMSQINTYHQSIPTTFYRCILVISQKLSRFQVATTFHIITNAAVEHILACKPNMTQDKAPCVFHGCVDLCINSTISILSF